MPPHNIAQLQLATHHLRLLQALLAQHVPHAQVWVYGSRITGHAHEGSDVDIVLRNPANLTAEIPELYELQEAVRESNLPMLIDIHDWAHLPTDFHHNIENNYVEIQG
ncbi:MAG: nucleotidyltransferase domain-containing protein [Rhodocyclaceae bacterium]|nr:nucleotidyltransferase domain-containing protein [Rhodocyclaceae bacterium]MBR4737101.1 nucleotidyltransferase domain-containing protein [Rhodocyclaceae bacterium]